MSSVRPDKQIAQRRGRSTYANEKGHGLNYLAGVNWAERRTFVRNEPFRRRDHYARAYVRW